MPTKNPNLIMSEQEKIRTLSNNTALAAPYHSHNMMAALSKQTRNNNTNSIEIAGSHA